jgi:hypothetical protein
MIHLASESVEDVVLRPGLRYAILKVTNHVILRSSVRQTERIDL